MATPEQVYAEWRSSLTKPDDSIFYYHPDLERILLGLSIFAINSGPLLQNLGKAESLKILNIYIPELITAWIDEDDDAFKTMFELTMTVSEAYLPAVMAAKKEYPSKTRQLNKLATFFSYAIATGGDMNPALAQTLLDDFSTDGHKLHSAKIQDFGAKLLTLLQLHGPDIPIPALNHLNAW